MRRPIKWTLVVIGENGARSFEFTRTRMLRIALALVAMASLGAYAGWHF